MPIKIPVFKRNSLLAGLFDSFRSRSPEVYRRIVVGGAGAAEIHLLFPTSPHGSAKLRKREIAFGAIKAWIWMWTQTGFTKHQSHIASR